MAGNQGGRSGLEVWREIEGFEGLYEVSNHGRVRSMGRTYTRRLHGKEVAQRVRERVLRPGLGAGRYPVVHLSKTGRVSARYIHDLVARAFLGPRPDGMQVRHGEDGALDASEGNICYGTPTENAADRVRDGTDARGSKNPSAKLTEDQVREIRRLARQGLKGTAIGRQMGVSRQTVNNITLHGYWSHIQ